MCDEMEGASVLKNRLQFSQIKLATVIFFACIHVADYMYTDIDSTSMFFANCFVEHNIKLGFIQHTLR